MIETSACKVWRVWVVSWLALLLAACGSGDNLPTTPFVPAPGTGQLIIAQPDLNTMPQANSVTASVVTDGSGSRVLSFITPTTTQAPIGTFVGGGRGNKGIVQLSGFDGLKVADMGSLELDTQLISGTNNLLYMNFIVDLDCVKNENTTASTTLTLADIRASRRILVWDPSFTGTVLQPDGYNRYSANTSTAAWFIVGSPSFGIGLNPSGPPTSLTSLVAAHPNACIADGVSGDGGLPRNVSIPACVTGAALPTTASAACGVSHAGALLLLGDSGNTSQREWRIKRIKIKDRTATFQ
jgi:hypothetical protein